MGLLLWSSCTSSAPKAYLSATDRVRVSDQTLSDQLQSHQWGGWHRVPRHEPVALIQQQAMLLEQEEQHDQALDAINAGLAEWPFSTSLLECRASIYGCMGYWRAAEGDFARVTRMMPHRAGAWAALARCRMELGLWHAARQARVEAQRLSRLP